MWTTAEVVFSWVAIGGVSYLIGFMEAKRFVNKKFDEYKKEFERKIR